MSKDEFNKILKQVRETLTPEERREFSKALLESDSVSNQSTMDKSVLEALEELGVVGSITEGPGDLSTNPKYMEGFGKDAE